MEEIHFSQPLIQEQTTGDGYLPDMSGRSIPESPVDKRVD